MNLVLCLTEQCNLRCTYCYYKESQADRKTVMDDATLEQAIKIALDRTIFFRQSYLNITFFGGEPLLRRDAIYKGVEFAKAVVDDAMDKGKISKNFKLQFAVNTNGTLFDDEFFDFCEREKFRIYLSLDGPEYHHDIARRTVSNTGSFKAIEKHIPRFVKLGAIALSTVTRAHVNTLFESVKWLHEQGFQSLTTSVDFDGKWSGEDFDKLALQYQKMAEYWRACRGFIRAMYIMEPSVSPRMEICSLAHGSSPQTQTPTMCRGTFSPALTRRLATRFENFWTTTKKNARGAIFATAAVHMNAPARVTTQRGQ